MRWHPKRLWGAQTQRSLQNFAISDERIPLEIIQALAWIKRSCATVNGQHALLSPQQVELICTAADAIAAGQHNDQFPLRVWQTGSGTQTNMNINEVISNLASQASGTALGSHTPVHPNDHVNRSQSTNDVFPAAIHVAAAKHLKDGLLPALDALVRALDAKAQAWMPIVKIGRTHLQDAVPLRLGDEVGAWRDQLKQAQAWLVDCLVSLGELPLGGTAVGTGLNTPPGFRHAVAEELSRVAGVKVRPADNLFAVMAGHDALVQAMGQLRLLAVALLRIANDVRLLGCGPRAGLGELRLPANEPGSSIMPGKNQSHPVRSHGHGLHPGDRSRWRRGSRWRRRPSADECLQALDRLQPAAVNPHAQGRHDQLPPEPGGGFGRPDRSRFSGSWIAP